MKDSIMFIDAHAHLDRYGDRLDEALQQIDEERIFTVATAMDVPSYLALVEIAQRSELILPTFGIHPRRAADYGGRLQEIVRHIEASPAIGEIGLDFHWVKDASTYPAQQKVLEYFFAAAREQNKFVNLHTKGGERRILDLLEKYGIRRAVIHWYSGPLDILRAMVAFGCYFTIGVEASYSDSIQAIAREIPDPLLLTETDNPGGLQWLKGEVGMPKEIDNVVKIVAALRNSTPTIITQTVQANFLRLIADDPWLKDCRAILTRSEF